MSLACSLPTPAALSGARRHRHRRPSAVVAVSAGGAPKPQGQRSVLGSATLRSALPLRREARRVRHTVLAAAQPPSPEAPPSPPLTLAGRTTDLGDDVLQVSVLVKERFAYEVEYSLNRGTSDNCYVLRAAKSCALIGLPDNDLADAFMKEASRTFALDSITHIVMPHFGPKRLNALITILKAHKSGGAPLQIMCANAAAPPLREVLSGEDLKEQVDYDIVVVRNGGKLAVGAHRLYFTLTPTPRWPDLFSSYHEPSGTLITGKLFSSHVCTEDAKDTRGWDEYKEDWKNFFQCTLAASAKQSKQALQKLQGYQVGDATSTASRARVVRQIAPMHGVIVNSNVSELVREYWEWTEQQIKAADEVTVAIIYASAYGNTTALAQAIARGASKAGVGVESLNCEMASPDEVKELMKRSSGFALGSPTLGGHMPTPVQEALGAILKDSEFTRRQPCGVFGSFGWSGEAVDLMYSSLKDSGFTFAFDPIRCKFKPTLEMLQICEESGTDLAQAVLKEKRKKTAAAGAAVAFASSGTEKAVGRLVGSLCVVTAGCEDASSAMLASWVSQASFSPPGITVAVAKDRAIEGLLTTGSKFVVSILAEGAVKNAMKQMLKPFKPGEDRFAGYETLKAEKTGLEVIPEAAAYIECTVSNRMETGDHWVMYATVDSGNVLAENALTALHHRKVGTNY